MRIQQLIVWLIGSNARASRSRNTDPAYDKTLDMALSRTVAPAPDIRVF